MLVSVGFAMFHFKWKGTKSCSVSSLWDEGQKYPSSDYLPEQSQSATILIFRLTLQPLANQNAGAYLN